MSDEEFLRAVETCTYPGDAFHHREHLRLAWLYLRLFESSEAETHISAAIRRFAAHNGAPGKFNEALTISWMRRVSAAISIHPTDRTFDDFLLSSPDLCRSFSLPEP